MMTILLMLPLLYCNFIQKWYFPQGIDWGAGRIMIADTDRDEHFEFIFATYGDWPTRGIYIYELHLPHTWAVDTVLYPNAPLIWDIGDFDFDGLYDIVMQCGSTNPYWIGITVFESPDSFSYPTQEVWRDTVGFALVTPICVHDIDQDGLSEIAKVCGYYTDLEIYESVGDNYYNHIATVTTAATHTPMSTLAVGDFDSDNQNEFVWGYSGGEYSIWECTGDNSYDEVLLQQLPTLNIVDCFSVPDADGDGKMEFVVKGFVIPSAEIHAFIFEATGDNTYEIIKTFTLWLWGDYYGGYSDVGDVDGDSIPEIVLEGRQTVHIIKAAGNDSFYVWETLPGNASGSSVRVYDVDGNGLSEVIISGNNETKIYEYQVGIEEGNESPMILSTFRVHPNPFTNVLGIRFDTQYTGDLSVNVYDVSGKMIKNLYSGSADGSNTLIWYGDDNNGRRVPQGIYFIRIENLALQQTICKKVIKIR